MYSAKIRSKWGRTIGVDRVHLGDDDLALDVELVEDVERCDGGDVARAENQGHGGAAGAATVLAGGPLPCLLRGDAGAQPHLGVEPVEEQCVPARAGEDVDQGAAAALVHGLGRHRVLAGREAAQHVQVGADVLRQGPRAGGPVLGGPGRIGGVALGCRARRGERGGVRRRREASSVPAGRSARPAMVAVQISAFVAQFGDGAVQRVAVEVGCGVRGHSVAPSTVGVGGARGQEARRAACLRRMIGMTSRPKRFASSSCG